MISIIVAMSPNHAIGYQGSLPWHLPEDLAHFKKLTMGHAIIMGRHTFESLPHGALPGRRNIVLSRKHDFAPVGCEVYVSLEEALKECKKNNECKKNVKCNKNVECNNGDETFVIGGAEVYRAALPLADKLYVTLVDDNPSAADTFFPLFNLSDWTITKEKKHDGFSFLELHRICGDAATRSIE